MLRRRLMKSRKTEGVNSDNYLTIEALEDGLTARLSRNACEYCVDGDGNWKILTKATYTESINKGQFFCFRGNIVPDSSTNGIGTFTVTKNFNLKGNVMSMLFGDNGKDSFSIEGKNYAFASLFNGCSKMQSVSAEFLPATTLSEYCYYSMFKGCSAIVTSPNLPAQTMKDFCYGSMFESCTKLFDAPKLTALNLAKSCYRRMFAYCRAMYYAPELPANDLADSCYYQMFAWSDNLGAPPELPATTLTNYCYYWMFYGNTRLLTAPELPAITLAPYCYEGIFDACSNLSYVKAMFTTTPGTDYTSNWMRGVAAIGTFVKNKNATWDVIGESGIPEGWNIKTE